MPPDHSHHAPGSPGSACVACHMPKTSYALRTAIRSHRIDSPSPSPEQPNACNLCHLDRSLAWTASELGRLWGVRAAASSTLPASAEGLLARDAAERVVWADAFGDPASRAASGDDWEAPLLARAERDPSAVIRFVAARSARSYPGATRTLLDADTLDALVARRDNRDVYVAE